MGVTGIRYVLPLFIEADLRIDTDGDVELDLSSELQLTSRLFFHWEVNTDEEYQFGLEYILSKQFSVVAVYDDEYEAGAGLKILF